MPDACLQPVGGSATNDARSAYLSPTTSNLVGSSDNRRFQGDTRGDRPSGVWLTVDETAYLTDGSRQAIQKACKENRLITRMESGRGGQAYRVRLDSLPQAAQVRYWRERLTGSGDYQDEDQTEAVPEISESARRTALLRADLVRLYLSETVHPEGGSLVERKKLFSRRYAAGEWPDLLAVLGPTSYQTLERWRKTLSDADDDPLSLAPRYGRTSGSQARSITPRQAEALLRYALMPNQLRTSEIIRQARQEWREHGIDGSVSDMTVRRWLDDWRKENTDLWTVMRKGEKALNDQVMPYLQRRREAVEVGDLVVADGHVLNFLILNPSTGKPKRRMTLVLVYDFRSGFPLGWEIMPTENTQSIASAYRHAILRLGFVPRAFYLDNGKAFRARFFKGTRDFRQAGVDGLFERLGCEVIHAQSYHGQSKTVERFFGTFAELERLQPSYTGTSIEAKPAHMKRGERLHRSLHASIADHTAPTLDRAHEIIASWFDEYVQRPSSGLHGLTPMQVVEQSLERVARQEDFERRRVTEQELAYLMMSTTTKTLYRNGISFNGEWYYDDALYRFEKGKGRTRFVVRYDLHDLRQILVYTERGEFVCTAVRGRDYHPAARVLGTDADIQALEDGLQQKRELQKGSIQTARAFVRELYPQAPDAPAPVTETRKTAKVIDYQEIIPPSQTTDNNTILFESDLED